ncbi:hypothetical protein L195_g063654, partial [Trifolium pratense]
MIKLVWGDINHFITPSPTTNLRWTNPSKPPHLPPPTEPPPPPPPPSPPHLPPHFG